MFSFFFHRAFLIVTHQHITHSLHIEPSIHLFDHVSIDFIIQLYHRCNIPTFRLVTKNTTGLEHASLFVNPHHGET
jgi:hypothetical protein